MNICPCPGRTVRVDAGIHSAIPFAIPSGVPLSSSPCDHDETRIQLASDRLRWMHEATARGSLEEHDRCAAEERV